jgi:hypothetical protein
MSSFACDQCGAFCWDTDRGYITGCEHYPPDVVPTDAEMSEIERISKSAWKIVLAGRRDKDEEQG